MTTLEKIARRLDFLKKHDIENNETDRLKDFFKVNLDLIETLKKLELWEIK